MSITAVFVVCLEGGLMSSLEHFRQLIPLVDPLLLTKADRVALIDLLNRCFHAQALKAESAGAVHGSPA